MASDRPATSNVTEFSQLSSKDKLTSETPTELELLNPSVCVICLERVPDEAIALPCRHDQFHFSCLATWLQQNRTCPLCKTEVKGIRYRDAPAGLYTVYYLADQGPPTNLPPRQVRLDARRRPLRPPRRCETDQVIQTDESTNFRRSIYDRKLFSMYVGSNRISGFRNIGVDLISQDERLIVKAKKWIRRELKVFDFLKPDSVTFGRTDRRASNVEFLLEYIVAVLKTIDIKGSAGQAEELLKDYLGRQNARLFLHELESWLRSPYEHLKDWDEAVQYPAATNW